jgi:AbrB family looped-hinge helix DNA binding protein
MPETIMSAKGQIVIPQNVRERLKLRPGQRFEVDIMPDGSILVIPVPRDVIGVMRLPSAVRLEKALREEREREKLRGDILEKELRSG